MKNIGLIDDKDPQRLAFMRKLDLKLEEEYPGWKVIDSKPFKEINDYNPWILENEISILIIDERLNEGKLEDGTHVGYYGSSLVKELRNYFKDFPIYCITNFDISDELKESTKYFNLVLSRDSFDKDIKNYLNSFIKTGISFYTEFQKELGRLGELSEKIAKGEATRDDIAEIRALQTRLVIPHLTQDLQSREKYLTDLEEKIEEIKGMQQTLIKYLDKK